jgi:hypothetical protein
LVQSIIFIQRDRTEEDLDLAAIENSHVKIAFSGRTGHDVKGADLFVWAGGYEWLVTFDKTVGDVKFIKAPAETLALLDTAIAIELTPCVKCIYFNGLVTARNYYLPGLSRNDYGWSNFLHLSSKLPRLPKAPWSMIEQGKKAEECLHD